MNDSAENAEPFTALDFYRASQEMMRCAYTRGLTSIGVKIGDSNDFRRWNGGVTQVVSRASSIAEMVRIIAYGILAASRVWSSSEEWNVHLAALLEAGHSGASEGAPVSGSEQAAYEADVASWDEAKDATPSDANDKEYE